MNKSKTKLLIIDTLLLAVFIAFDQITKYLAVLNLKDQAPFQIIPGVLELRYLENNGAAFGMLQNQKIFFVFVAAIILAVIAYVMLKTPAVPKYTILHILLVFIAGGAIGNMIDRVMQDYVVDFIYFILIDFPIFNVADIYLTCATVGLAIAILFVYKEEDFSFLSLKKKMTRDPKYTDNEK